MTYKLAIFDLDGTILDTLDDLADSVNVVLSIHGYPCHTKSQIRSFVGNGIRKLIERALPDGISQNEINQIHKEFTLYYKEHCADKTAPYAGIMELLQRLKAQNIMLAVVSNKADYAVQELCRQYFAGIFDYVTGERAGIPRKPEPDLVLEVLGKLEVPKTQAVYIGDSEVDIQTAKNAGLDLVAVNWGFRDADILKSQGAEVIVSTPKEILEKF